MTHRRIPLITLALAGLLLLPALAMAQDSGTDALPDGGELLAPGRYADTSVGPTIEFRVSDGWRVGDRVDGPLFSLELVDVPGSVLSITRYDGDVFVDSCDPTSLTSVDASVRRLAEVIGANPLLNVAPPATTEVDGRPGVQLDVAVPALRTECRARFPLLWAVPDLENGQFIQVPEQQSRFILLDVDGAVIVIAIETFPGVPFGPMLDASMALVDSIRFSAGAPDATLQPTTTAEPAETASPSQTESPEPTPEPSASSPPVRTPTPIATDAPDDA